MLASLNLPREAGGHPAALLEGAYREEPEPEPASLLELRGAVNAMLPRVDLTEELLEVFSWTGTEQAFLPAPRPAWRPMARPGQARGRRSVGPLAQRAVCGARRLVPHQFC